MRAIKITKTITPRDEKSVDKYFNEITKYEVLSPDEEVQLFNQYKGGDESALQKIVNHNLRFVVSVAKQYQHGGSSLSDLINEGNIGLMKAAKRFDVSRGFKFISYAVWWIRQSIISSLNDKSRKIRIPTNILTQTKQILAKRDEILQRYEREPTIEELSKATEIPADKIKSCLQNNIITTSLDAPIGSDGDASFVQMMTDSSIPPPDFNLAHLESLRLDITELLSTLKTRQAHIIAMYFGIDNRKQNLQEIADYFGLSRERARQIKDRGLHRLKINAKSMKISCA